MSDPPYRDLRTSLYVGITIASVVVSALVWASCGNSGAGDSVLVFAAASLSDSLGELAETYEGRHETEISISFGGSTALARQINAGAPADIFVSAGQPAVDLLISSGRVARDDTWPVLGNELVVVTPGDGASIDSLESLVLDEVERVAVVDPQLGPAGWYAEQALRTSGLWESIEPKILFANDVRAALSYVAAGNADAGIVYRTDAATEPGVEMAFSVSSDLHSPITYVVALTVDGARSARAATLIEFLVSAEAAATFGESGFVTP